MTIRKKTTKKTVKKTKKTKPKKIRETKEMKKAKAIRRDELLFSVRTMRTVIENQISGILNKILFNAEACGENPVALSNYLKQPIFSLFSGFDNQTKQMEAVKSASAKKA